jgi:hypothetical protein
MECVHYKSVMFYSTGPCTCTPNLLTFGKHSSLICHMINYSKKSFIILAPGQAPPKISAKKETSTPGVVIIKNGLPTDMPLSTVKKPPPPPAPARPSPARAPASRKRTVEDIPVMDEADLSDDELKHQVT